MKKIKEILERNVALLVVFGTTIIGFLMNLAMPSPFGLEAMLMIVLGFMSALGFLGALGKVTVKGKIIFLTTLLLCVGAYFHIDSIDIEQSEFEKEFTIEETKDFHLLNIKDYKLLYLDIDEVKYNDEHPIKLYEFYKTDIFGYKLLPDLKVKSDLMDDYANPRVLNR